MSQCCNTYIHFIDLLKAHVLVHISDYTCGVCLQFPAAGGIRSENIEHVNLYKSTDWMNTDSHSREVEYEYNYFSFKRILHRLRSCELLYIYIYIILWPVFM